MRHKKIKNKTTITKTKTLRGSHSVSNIAGILEGGRYLTKEATCRMWAAKCKTEWKGMKWKPGEQIG